MTDKETIARLESELLAERQRTEAYRSLWHGSENKKLQDQLLSALATRKPLVDALKKMPEVAYQTIIEHAGVELGNLPNELQCICDDALAKVKE